MLQKCNDTFHKNEGKALWNNMTIWLKIQYHHMAFKYSVGPPLFINFQQIWTTVPLSIVAVYEPPKVIVDTCWPPYHLQCSLDSYIQYTGEDPLLKIDYALEHTSIDIVMNTSIA